MTISHDNLYLQLPFCGKIMDKERVEISNIKIERNIKYSFNYFNTLSWYKNSMQVLIR